MALKKVENYLQYLKDSSTSNVVNKDVHAYNARRKKIALEKQRQQDVEDMKSELEALKALVNQLSGNNE